jgi:GntR family transcriptional regulator
MTSFFIEAYSALPAHAQIQEQIRFACLQGTIEPGDALPSIRELARRLGIGDGTVRRAYRELSDVGFLVTERRRHVVAATGRIRTNRPDFLLKATEQSEQLAAWAREHRVSNVALHRLLLRLAVMRERSTPSLLYVDICARAAQKSAARIAKAWGMGIVGTAANDFGAVWNAGGRDVSVVLVNEYVRQDVLSAGGPDPSRVFPVRMRLEKRLHHTLDHLPARSRVLFLCAEKDLKGAALSMTDYCQGAFGQRLRFQSRTLSDVRDLPALIQERRHDLFLFSPLAWEDLPRRIKRMKRVTLAFIEPDADLLEEARIHAGVFL